jgi:hypothetical protein
MILGLTLESWVKIITISMALFIPIWVMIEILTGRLSVELIRIDMEEKEDDE